MSYDEAFKLLEETSMRIEDICKECGINYSWFHSKAVKRYGKSWMSDRKRQNYRDSKLGDKNPMFGKTLEKHHNYVGDVSDGKGYLMRVKPCWYTGRKGSKHVFVHHIVMCEALGLTEVPSGFCVHHVDHDPKNNDISNLMFLSMSAHSKLHQLERATTISKESRANQPEVVSLS
jgi:hypothetical protein